MKRTAVTILLALCPLLLSGQLVYRPYLPDDENNLLDRKIELMARCLEAYDVAPLPLPRAATDEELEQNMTKGFRRAMRDLGVDPERILASFEAHDWSGGGPEMEDPVDKHQLVLDNSIRLKQPVGGVDQIRIFVISRGFSWQKGKVLVDDSRGGPEGKNKNVEDFVNDVLLKVPRIAELLKSQHALVAIGTASAEMGEKRRDGPAKEETRAAERARELAKALAHSQGITCPVFTSSWGRYKQDEPDQASQREIVILGLVKSPESSSIDLGNADLRGLMAAFASKQRGQQLDPEKYSARDKDPKLFVDGQ